MTRSNILASLLYKTAVELKKYDFGKLIWSKYRNDLIDSISAMQFLTHCVGMRCISDKQAEIIVSVLKNTFHYDTDEIADQLKDAAAKSDYSQNYYDLLFNMQLCLASCIHEITERKRNCAESVRRYIFGFHNMPRAFLSLSDRMNVSPDEALNYSKSWFKID